MAKTYLESLDLYCKCRKNNFKDELYMVLFGLLGISLLAGIFYGLGLENIHVLSRVNFLLHTILLLITMIIFGVLINYMEKNEPMRIRVALNIENNLKELDKAINIFEHAYKYKRTIVVIITYIGVLIGGTESLLYIAKMLQEATHVFAFQIFIWIGIGYIVYIPSMLMKGISIDEAEGLRKFCNITGMAGIAFIIPTIYDFLADSSL